MARPDEDERLTAAMAHASIIANAAGLTGLTLTVVLWATQRRRSRFVRAHIVQALVYQAGTLLGVVLLMLLWSGCLLLSLLPAALRPDLYRDGTLPDTFWVALFGLILPIGYGFAATVYALYGAYMVYRGKRFAYPLAGRLVARDLEESQSGASTSATSAADAQTSASVSATPLRDAAPSLPTPGGTTAAHPPTPLSPPDHPVAMQPPASAPPAASQTGAAEKEVAPASPEAASPPSALTATTVAAPSPPAEAPPAVTSAESAAPSAASAPSVPSASDVVGVVPMQDALDQGSRPTDRVAVSPADTAPGGQPPEER